MVAARGDEGIQLPRLIGQFPGVLWTTDTALRITSLQGAALTAVDAAPERWVGTTLAAFYQTNDRAYPPLAAHYRALAGASAAYEVSVWGRWWDCRVEPLRDAAGHIVGTVGLALDSTERTRAQEIRVQQAHEAALRATVSAALNAGDLLPATLRRCAEAIVAELDAALARIWTLDPDSDVLELQASAGLYLHTDGAHSRIPVGALKIGRIAQTRQPHLTNDVLTDPHLSDLEWARRERLVAFAGYPLLVGERVVGVLALFARRPLAEATLETLAAVADALAQGIERQRVEEVLWRSRQQYAELVNSLDGIVWEADARTVQFTFVSRQAERLLGYPVAQWLAEPTFWQDHMHPDDRSWAIPFCAAATAAQRPHQFEYRMLAADGRTVWLRDIATVVVEDGRPVKLRGVMVDITEQKRTEMALREKEEQYRSIFEASTDGLIITDLDGYVVEASPAACAMHGYTREEFIGLHGDAFHPPEHRHTYGEYTATVAASGHYQTQGPHLHRRKDGTPFPVEVQGATFTYKGRPHILGVVRDITERQRAEAALRETEAQYRAIFEATSDGLVINDLEGHLVEVNPAFCAMHGYTREELLRLDYRAFVHPDSYHLFHEYVATSRAGETFQGQAVDIRKDGTPFHVEVHGAPFLYKSAPHILGVVRDITERVEAYQLLERRVAERTRELATLLDISRTIASTLELKPLLGLILDQLHVVADYRRASIFIVEGEEVVLLGSRGPAAYPEGADLSAVRYRLEGIAPVWATISRGEPIILADLQVEGPMERAVRTTAAARAVAAIGDIRAWLAVPLTLQDRVIGLLTLTSAEPGAYTPRHAELAMAIASQAAIAIENARLYQQAQQVAALEERQRLARELHDSVSQALYGIVLGTQTARTLLQRDPTQVAEPLDYVLGLAEAGLAEMRALIFELRPESLETEGLVAALMKQAAALRARHQLVVETALGEEPMLPLTAKEAIYRIAQEALHNVVKHAAARRVVVQLTCAGGWVWLEVRDDGMGFDPGGDFAGHLGQRSMRERAAYLGGGLEVESAPGRGTTVRARVPCPASSS